MTTEESHFVTRDGEPEATEKVETGDANVELREALKREKALTAGYRGELMSTRLEAIGLNHTKGLGKAIAKEYDGDMTVEAVKAYAQTEYGHEGTVETEPPEVTTADKLETLSTLSEAITPPPEIDKARETTDKMDDPESGRDEAVASVNAKMAQFARENYPG